jgi:hypothetical protein
VLTFFQRHVLTGIGLLVGPVIAIGSLILHTIALREMGLPIEIWVAVGLGIFFLSVVGILMRWEQERGSPVPLAVPHSSNSAVGAVATIPSPASSPPSRKNDGRTEVYRSLEVLPRPADQPSDRVFITTQPDEVFGLLDGKMLSEQRRIGAPFLGKWMCLMISVDDASIHDGGGTVWVDGTRYSFRFNQAWLPHLETLIRGQLVKLVGRIREVRSGSLAFNDCEII